MNSVNLTPQSGTNLPSSVSVTPFINGVAYPPTLTCTVQRSQPSSSATISGNSNLCVSTNSNYTISNLGVYTVTSWTSSNTAVATIGATTSTSVTVNGIAEGSAVLTANLTNACNQNLQKTFNINIGRAKISNYTIQGTFDNVPQGYQSLVSVVAATGASNYIWSVTPTTTLSCTSSQLPTITSNGLLSRIINWQGCVGTYRLRCEVTNSCGSVFYSDKLVKVFSAQNNPCPPARMAISKNPIKEYDDFELNIIDYPNLPPCNSPSFRTNTIVKIYDFNGKEIYNGVYEDEDKINLKNLKLSKGFYFVHAQTDSETIFKEKLIVE